PWVEPVSGETPVTAGRVAAPAGMAGTTSQPSPTSTARAEVRATEVGRGCFRRHGQLKARIGDPFVPRTVPAGIAGFASLVDAVDRRHHPLWGAPNHPFWCGTPDLLTNCPGHGEAAHGDVRARRSRWE